MLLAFLVCEYLFAPRRFGKIDSCKIAIGKTFLLVAFVSTLTMCISDTSPSIAEFHRSIFDFCSLQLTRLNEMETHYTGAV